MSGNYEAARPFSIHVHDDELDGLKQKLPHAVFAPEIHGDEWQAGVPSDLMKRLLAYWKDEYDWRAKEKELNRYPQFCMKIHVSDGFEPLDIHFIHQKSPASDAIPLLFVHGWPGLYLEAIKVLQALALQDDQGPSFHVVVPSLPNFGFSSGVRKKGFGIKYYAEVCHQLMLNLGYTQYVTQGGDFGYLITRMMGAIYPSHCRASHVNMAPFGRPTLKKNPLLYLQDLFSQYSASDQKAIECQQEYMTSQTGYYVLQSSKPQTLAHALTDSPVALLAWIVEKLHAWTDNYPWTDDEILTWVSIYWFSTAGPGASIRIYYEWTQTKDPAVEEARVGWVPQVKYGLAHFPKELGRCPRLWANQMGNVVHQSDADRGGHFAAWENPSFLVRDLKTMFGKGGGAYGVLGSKDGQ